MKEEKEEIFGTNSNHETHRQIIEVKKPNKLFFIKKKTNKQNNKNNNMVRTPRTCLLLKCPLPYANQEIFRTRVYYIYI